MILLVIAIAFFYPAGAQIKKGQFLVGGDATYRSEKIGHSSGDKLKQFGFNVNAGYFVINKLALGLRTGLATSSFKIESQNVYNRSTSLTLAPFARYYFLPVNAKWNVFADAAYINGTRTSKHNQLLDKQRFSFSGYDVKAGPVYFINKNVAVELSVGIQDRNNTQDPVFASAIGLQVHL